VHRYLDGGQRRRRLRVRLPQAPHRDRLRRASLPGSASVAETRRARKTVAGREAREGGRLGRAEPHACRSRRIRAGKTIEARKASGRCLSDRIRSVRADRATYAAHVQAACSSLGASR
jgi:hypothetical protein